MAANNESMARPGGGKPLSVRLAVGCWLAMTAAVSLRTLMEPERHTIFPILANSAAHWWHDQPLYADYKPLAYYRYSPSFARAAPPLWLLGGRAGGLVWSFLYLGVIASGPRRFLRVVRSGDCSALR